MKIVIACPSPDFVPIDFVGNLLSVVAYTKQHIPNADVVFTYKTGVRTDKNRNYMLDEILKTDTDYILWVDADMLYPHNIIEKYLEYDFDVIGCLYFKRTAPFDPVAYINNPDLESNMPFMSLDPRKLPTDSVVEVDGLGFGGLMVKRTVYDELGEDKWSNYGLGFHLPYKNREGFTHDLSFCKAVKKNGFSVKLHTGVKPGHLAQTVITQKDFENARI